MSSAILENLLQTLPSLSGQHAPGSQAYKLLQLVARKEIETRFSGHVNEAKEFQPFGALTFPYHKMGAIDSLNLFDLDELIIFSFYLTNRDRYRRVLDLGANLGLHSIILDKCGFEVLAYEPDPQHFIILQENLRLNRCSNVRSINAAISDVEGEKEFVRVLGNTTGSHLAGSKANPYGPLERFPVNVEPFQPLMEWADLIKMDVEGHEKQILVATNRDQWLDTDALVEVGNKENAVAIYEHFSEIGVRLFSQKTNWHQVRNVDDMPFSHHDGTLLVSCKDEILWL